MANEANTAQVTKAPPSDEKFWKIEVQHKSNKNEPDFVAPQVNDKLPLQLTRGEIVVVPNYIREALDNAVERREQSRTDPVTGETHHPENRNQAVSLYPSRRGIPLRI